MRTSLFSHIGIALVSALTVASIFKIKEMRQTPVISYECPGTLAQSVKNPHLVVQSASQYKPMSFDFSTVTGLTESQLTQHHTLYKGYVTKFNEIQSELSSISPLKGNTTYSQLRALKVAETFALNGTILHELYFENICKGAGTKPGAQTEKLIIKSFGSIERFKEQLFAVASSARGWVLTGFTFYDNTLRNYLLDAHNELVPLLTLPVLIVDTYEHAYMIDFGINRAKYLDILWNTINWDVVEERVTNWLQPYLPVL